MRAQHRNFHDICLTNEKTANSSENSNEMCFLCLFSNELMNLFMSCFLLSQVVLDSWEMSTLCTGDVKTQELKTAIMAKCPLASVDPYPVRQVLLFLVDRCMNMLVLGWALKRLLCCKKVLPGCAGWCLAKHIFFLQKHYSIIITIEIGWKLTNAKSSRCLMKWFWI